MDQNGFLKKMKVIKNRTMEDNENHIFNAIKSFLYIFLIGAVYYAGGYGYALVFTKEEKKRTRIAKYNLCALIFEILLLLGVFIFGMFSDDFNYDLMTKIIKGTFIHTAISFIGSLFYLVSWMFSK